MDNLMTIDELSEYSHIPKLTIYDWTHKKEKTGIPFYKPDHPFRNSHNYIFEHRLVIEKQIDRYLQAGEPVHHINKIRNDNRPENLMAFISDSAHQRFEKGGKYSQIEIIFDGRKQTNKMGGGKK